MIFTKYHGIRDQRRKKMRHTMRSESQYPICDIWYSVKSKCATYESSPSSTERISSPPRPPPPRPHHLSPPPRPPLPPYQHCHRVVEGGAGSGGSGCWPVLLFLLIVNFFLVLGTNVHKYTTNQRTAAAVSQWSIYRRVTASRIAVRLRTTDDYDRSASARMSNSGAAALMFTA